MAELPPEQPEVKHIPDDMLGKSPEQMTEAERIAAALETASHWGGIDGGHHKMWTIDQMVRVLTGSPLEKSAVHTDVHGTKYTFDQLGESAAYQAFVAEHNNGEDGPDTHEWDTGVAP